MKKHVKNLKAYDLAQTVMLGSAMAAGGLALTIKFGKSVLEDGNIGAGVLAVSGIILTVGAGASACRSIRTLFNMAKAGGGQPGETPQSRPNTPEGP